MHACDAGKLTGLGGSLRFGNINGQNEFLTELPAGAMVAVIDLCGEHRFGKFMAPSDRPTLYVKWMEFADDPRVGVAPLYMFFFVPIIFNLLRLGYHVYVNCKKGSNRSGGLMYAVCLALKLKPDVAWAHLRRIRKQDVVVNPTGVMYTAGGICFEAQVRELYSRLSSTSGASTIMAELKDLKYSVIPEWVEKE
jgi:hypothetical protein